MKLLFKTPRLKTFSSAPVDVCPNEIIFYLIVTIIYVVRRGADKSLAFPVCSTTKRIFLGWVKEVRTTKS
jgi:hypothetical protein